MTELLALIRLVAGLGGLALAGALVASCLRLRSPLEFALAVYVLSWAFLVALAYALSPVELLTRSWLLLAIYVLLAGALVGWAAAGRPRPPPARPALRSAAQAIRGSPVLLLLAIAVALGAAYSVALAFLTPVNEGDALAYHLARAAFWKQEHGLGYVAGAVEPRLNVNPPNAEIGMLATMLLSGGDRYVALPQLLAYGALTSSVYALARSAGLALREALFGALVFATLPVVVVQASGALNDLVVAAFLAAAGLFAFRPGRATLVVVALAVGLAVGTKFTAVLALPTLALAVLFGASARRLLPVAAAAVVGCVLGSVWYLVNLDETGDLDGGLAESADQRAEASAGSILTTALRLALDLVDLSGGIAPHYLLYVPAGLVLLSLGAVRALRARSTDPRSLALAGAGALTALVVLVPALADLGQRAVYKAWLLMGEPETTSWEPHFRLNVEADSTTSWFGPQGLLLLVAGTLVAVVGLLRARWSPALLVLALSPWVLLLTLAVTIVWDPWRGRFLVLGFALAAASWGALLQTPLLAWSVAAIGVVTLALSLANYQSKPSGFTELWSPSEPGLSRETIWGASRSDAQSRLRADDDYVTLYDFVEAHVPSDAHVAVAPIGNDFLSPYFGPRYTRRISIVTGGDLPPADADWLVETPEASRHGCRSGWRALLELESGGRVERRTTADGCP